MQRPPVSSCRHRPRPSLGPRQGLHPPRPWGPRRRPQGRPVEARPPRLASLHFSPLSSGGWGKPLRRPLGPQRMRKKPKPGRRGRGPQGSTGSPDVGIRAATAETAIW
eukprot:3587285-Pyramimonas_sp.AAC.1